MNNIIFLFLILLSIYSYGDNNPIKFDLKENWIQSNLPKNSEEISKASVQIQVEKLGRGWKTMGGKCSGSHISKDGHILTAFHCIEACLLDNNLITYDKSIIENENKAKEGKLTVAHVNLEASKSVKCNLEYFNQDGSSINLEATVLPPKGNIVRLTGKVNNHILKKIKSLHDQGYSDIAILKVDPQKLDKYKYLEINFINSFNIFNIFKINKKQDKVWSYSYPGRKSLFMKEFKHNKQYISNGLSLKSIMHNTCFENMNSGNYSKLEKFYNFIYANKDFYNLATASGSSGAPIVNYKGKIVGVVSENNFIPESENCLPITASPTNESICRLSEFYNLELCK